MCRPEFRTSDCRYHHSTATTISTSSTSATAQRQPNEKDDYGESSSSEYAPLMDERATGEQQGHKR
jgi:hypothetical protein